MIKCSGEEWKDIHFFDGRGFGVLLRVLPDFHLSNVAVIYLEVDHGAMQNLKGK